ncbi:MAG: outer membrane protein assembly factor [Planctomycetota bacterium]
MDISRALLLLAALSGPGSAAPQEPPAPAQPSAQGEQAQLPIVVAIRVQGRKRYTEKQLLDALGQKVGARLDPGAIDQGLKTLWDVFKVRAHTRTREIEGGVEILLDVVEMAVDLEPRFVGNAEIDVETLRKWAQIGERSELYLYQAPRVRQRLLEGYRREGHAFAEIDVVTRGSAEETASDTLPPDVIFEIREGPQVRVQDVIVHGSKTYPDTGMWFWRGGLQKLARVELGGPWLFNWKGEKFVEDTLNADLLAMRDVYRDQGFLDAVVEVDRLDYSADRSEVTIHVIVDEGTPYKVSKLSIVGVDLEKDLDGSAPAELLFPETELLGLCDLKPGKRFQRSTVRNDERALKTRYGKDGYLAHPSLQVSSWDFLDPELTYRPESHEVDVRYRIMQGRKRVVREVLFQGAEHTRDRVLRREISVLPGEVADIEEITGSLSRLYSTSYFLDDYAQGEHRDPVYRFLPVADPEHPELVDLEYQVEEGRVINFNIQGGVDSNTGLFGRLTMRMENFDLADLPSSPWSAPGEVYRKEAFHGAGQLLDLTLSPGTQINSWRVHFREPDVFGRHFDPYSLDLEMYRSRHNLDEYLEDRLNQTVKVGRAFGRKFSIFGGYTLQEVRVSDIDVPITGINDPSEFPIPEGIYEQEGSTDIVGPVFGLAYRKVDTFLNPREGVQVNWKNGVHGGPFGGDWDFVRTEVDADWFIPIGSEEEEVRSGFHLGGGIGVADGYGDTGDAPYTERFFLGGSKRLRGFKYRGVGPNIGGVPIGGATAVDATVEYHIPLYSVLQPGSYRRQEIFRATFFVDAGVLDPDPWSLDLSELRASVGFGFALTHPIPVIFNFGFPIESGQGDQEQTFSFRIMNLSF